MNNTSNPTGFLSRLLAALIPKPTEKTTPAIPFDAKHTAYWRGVPFNYLLIAHVRRKPGTVVARWRGLAFDPALTEPYLPVRPGQVAYWRGLPFDPAKRLTQSKPGL